MLLHPCEQGTPEWLALRAGIPTASSFDRIITAKTLKPSKQADAYLASLVAERILGRPLETAITLPMARGKEHEAAAVAAYEMLRDMDTQSAGFVTNDACTIGASPDRFVGDDGLLEIKCPMEATHMRYVLGLEQPWGDDYRAQVQGQLWICERQWVDFVSYCPGLPTLPPVRVVRDEEYIAALSAAVERFSRWLEETVGMAREKGWME